ncbi:MAG: S8 family serine peptidase [Frankiaceae bacterium]|nr:S8 family serine peptidase [Frankiaceae bacterium]
MTRRGRWAGVALAIGMLAVTVPAEAAGTAPQRTWNFDQIHVPNARSAGHSGSGVTVAVLDSWVDASHRDFEGRVLAGADCVGGTCKDGPASPDQCDHGTHVAGTVASSSFGVAPKAKILPVRVLTHDTKTGNCVGQPDDVAAGIRWAAGHGARVINLSLGPDVPGLSSSTAIPTAVSEAASQGIVVIFSAGNSSAPVANTYGADAIVIAATSRAGGLASYSQRGTGVDLAAPGGDPKTKDTCTQSDCITSLYPGNRYAVAAGTSMAAPHVAGVAALLLGQDPARTRDQVISRLEDTAKPLAQAGHGVVDAAAALGVPATTPRASSQPKPVPVIKPSRSAVARPVASPVPSPKASVAPSPLPSVVSPSASPTAPVATSTPLTGVPEPRAATPSEQERIPLPLTLLAAGLAMAAGASVAAFGRARQL